MIIIYLIFTQFGLEQYRYVYFNEFVDESNITYDCNIDGCGNWLTDYWGYSAKSIAEHINNSEIKMYISVKVGRYGILIWMKASIQITQIQIRYQKIVSI